MVIAMLENAGAKVYCAKDGGLRVTSDGKTVTAEKMN